MRAIRILALCSCYWWWWCSSCCWFRYWWWWWSFRTKLFLLIATPLMINLGTEMTFESIILLLILLAPVVVTTGVTAALERGPDGLVTIRTGLRESEVD
jgi:hypothetical protein